MKKSYTIILILLFVILTIVLSFNSCVSKKKWQQVMSEKDKTEKMLYEEKRKNLDLEKELDQSKIENIELMDNINSLRKNIEYSKRENITLEETIIKLQKELRLLNSNIPFLTKKERLFSINDFKLFGKTPTPSLVLPIIIEIVEKEFKASPFSANRLSGSQKLNEKTEKIIFFRDDKSEILSENNMYETIIYIVELYLDNSDSFNIEITYFPLIAGGKNDTKRYIGNSYQISSYNLVLNELIDTVKYKMINSDLKK